MIDEGKKCVTGGTSNSEKISRISLILPKFRSSQSIFIVSAEIWSSGKLYLYFCIFELREKAVAK